MAIVFLMSNAISKPQGFGRRGTARAGRPVSPSGGLRLRTAAPNPSDFRYNSEAREAIAAHAKAEATAERFTAKFNWWLTWVAFGILVTGVGAVTDFSGSADADTGGLQTVPMFSFENDLFFWSGILMVVIGGVWFVKGLLGAPALTMTDSHVSGFTLLGTKNIRWQDVARVKVTNDPTYGKSIEIHATRGTPSSNIILNCIPIYVGLIDKTDEEVMEAIRYFRPDL